MSWRTYEKVQCACGRRIGSNNIRQHRKVCRAAQPASRPVSPPEERTITDRQKQRFRKMTTDERKRASRVGVGLDWAFEFIKAQGARKKYEALLDREIDPLPPSKNVVPFRKGNARADR